MNCKTQIVLKHSCGSKMPRVENERFPCMCSLQRTKCVQYNVQLCLHEAHIIGTCNGVPKALLFVCEYIVFLFCTYTNRD